MTGAAPVGSPAYIDSRPGGASRRPAWLLGHECLDAFRRAAFGVLLLAGACSGPVPVASPGLAFETDRAPIGSPIEATVRFSVLPGAQQLTDDYFVFLHFLSDDGELMWAADHHPPTPTSEWPVGGTVEYTRSILVPLCPYLGNVTVQMGLYSLEDGTRLPLEGDDRGGHAYLVGQLSLLPPAENTRFSYRSGWHLLEYDSTCTRWRWSERAGVIAFANPRSDAVLYLNLNHQGMPTRETRVLTVSVGDRVAGRVEITSGDVVERFPLSAALLGDTDEVEVRLEVDRAFVPAARPDAETPDTRELGVRVLGAYLSRR